jgi:hypothetical protein
MRSLYFVVLLVASTILASHVGPAFAQSSTLTIVIVVKNGSSIVDLKMMTLVPQPWGTGDGGGLYGWGLLQDTPGISVSTQYPTTLPYDLPPGMYLINMCYTADLGGLMVGVVQSRLVVLQGDPVQLTMIVN